MEAGRLPTGTHSGGTSMRTIVTRAATLLVALALFASSASSATAGGMKVISISGGDDHECALMRNGSVYCWGGNGGGFLGDGTENDTDLSGPHKVIGGLKFVKMHSAYDGTCALTRRGAAYCWSFGTNGPQKVTGGYKFIDIGLGESGTTCAVARDGAAYCWGNNGPNGQLGDGTADSSASPRKVIGGNKFKSVVVGEYSACALTRRGAAYCWGGNYYGNLGDGTTEPSGLKGPQKVIGGHKFVKLAAGEDHFCGLTRTGAVYCWGENYESQLGVGTLDHHELDGPLKVRTSQKFITISAWGYETCGLTRAGAAYCWGSNGDGELGIGSSSGRSANTPRKVLGGHKFTSIGVGEGHVCAASKQGKVYCWGDMSHVGVKGEDALIPTLAP